MDADEDLAARLLTRAGAILEDASAAAILSDSRCVAERIAAVRDALGVANRLIDAAAVSLPIT